jgi:hypothetical protein
MKSVGNANLGAALQARNRAIGYHLFDPNVSFIDLGLRIKETEKQLVDELTVRVHLRFKPRGPAFEAFAITSPERVVDGGKIGFPVDIIEGDYRLQQWPAPPPRGHVFDPLRGGISISNEWSFGYGTLGGIVVDRDTKRRMLLSNSHVLAGSPYVQPGLRIFQPGSGDGGWLQHTVAGFTRDSMNVDIDAAVAELTDDRAVINDQFELEGVRGLGDPRPEMRLIKSGRGSRITKGIITSSGFGGVAKITYGGLTRVVHHVFHILQVPDSEQVSTGGDSGSWWLEESTNKVVGLHFAGNSVYEPGEYGLAITMRNVLDALNVDLML